MTVARFRKDDRMPPLQLPMSIAPVTFMVAPEVDELVMAPEVEELVNRVYWELILSAADEASARRAVAQLNRGICRLFGDIYDTHLSR